MIAAEIAKALGAAYRSGQWWRARCPVHQGTSPSLALRDGAQALVVHCHAGCARREILEELGRLGLLAGSSGQVPRQPAPEALDELDDVRRTALAREIWNRTRPAPGSLVEVYLRGRAIRLPVPPTLRFLPGCRHPSGDRWPALVARVDSVDGEFVAIHRTWLNRDGAGKAPLDPPRAAYGPLKGAAVRLAAAGEHLLIGEGIETCLSASQATGLPAWAALGKAGFGSVRLPAAVRIITFLCDADQDGGSERAARAAAPRLLAEGRRVRVAVPRVPGADFNDLARQEAINGRR